MNAQELAMELAELRKQNDRIFKQVRINVEELQSRIHALEELAEMVLRYCEAGHGGVEAAEVMDGIRERARELMEVKG